MYWWCAEKLFISFIAGVWFTTNMSPILHIVPQRSIFINADVGWYWNLQRDIMSFIVCSTWLLCYMWHRCTSMRWYLHRCWNLIPYSLFHTCVAEAVCMILNMALSSSTMEAMVICLWDVTQSNLAFVLLLLSLIHPSDYIALFVTLGSHIIAPIKTAIFVLVFNEKNVHIQLWCLEFNLCTFFILMTYYRNCKIHMYTRTCTYFFSEAIISQLLAITKDHLHE